MSGPASTRCGFGRAADVVCVTTRTSSSSVRYVMTRLNMKRSSCASGSGYVPSSSIGFCVARTKNGRSSPYVRPAAVTWYSCIASSSAACVLGGVRLISSARMICAKTGPLTNRRLRTPPSSSRISVPVMSAGMRSGVNWIRLKLRSRISASVFTSSVFASPGTPVIRQWPPVKSAIRIWSTTASCPTITLRSSDRIRSRPAPTFSATPSSGTSLVAMNIGSRSTRRRSMRERVDHFVDAHPIRLGRVPEVAGILLGIGPLPPVAHVRVPVDQHHGPLAIVEDRAEVGDEPTLLPGAPAEEGTQPGRLRVLFELVEAAENGVRRSQLHHVALGKDALQLAYQVVPLIWAVKVVEGSGPSAQQELAQYRYLRLGETQVPGFDKIDPGMLPESRVLKRQHDRIGNVHRRDALDPARQILFGCRSVDGPGLSPVFHPVATRLGIRRVLDPDKGPLQPGEARVTDELRFGLLHHRAGDRQHGRRGQHYREGQAPCHFPPSTIARSRSCARG